MKLGTGRLVVISGPSGSGKTTIIEALRVHARVMVSVSVTTRPPRAHELDGRDYHFVDRKRFGAMDQAGAFVETNDVFSGGHLYGSTWKDMAAGLADEDGIYLMEVDVVGARNIIAAARSKGLQPLFVFIEPPSTEELERRLRARATEDEDAVQRRLAHALSEMQDAREQGARIVVNEDLSEATQEIREILGLAGNAPSGATPIDPNHEEIA